MGFIKRIKSEYLYLTGALRALRAAGNVARNRTYTYSDMMEEQAERFGDRVAILSRTQSYTYAALNARANQYARWAQANGIAKGDTIALLMPNCPEYLAVWLGIVRVGGVCGLLNTNLIGAPLAHCINLIQAKCVIVDASLIEAYRTAEQHLDPGASYWAYGSVEEKWPRLDEALNEYDDSPLTGKERVPLRLGDKALYIYTSGTTGLPKAANIVHYRIMAIMRGFCAAANANVNDRNYIALPMYHTAGGVIGVGIAFSVGGSVFVTDKFSATQFWDDIADYDCTMFQYIGELCRYLLNSPAHPKERTHSIRKINGNGLRPDIWEAFQSRFKIPFILEWYAATEGNAVFFNFDQKVGAIGRIPKWAEKRFPTKIVEYDIDTQMPRRLPDGSCIECAVGETGEVISQILDDPMKPGQRFEGYSDRVASESKVLRDVFEDGDAWFRMGDLIYKDALGYFYFVDRIGDTFRWKGENVATSEVSEILTGYEDVKEANVYGVHIDCADGRAGMASLVADEGLNLADFYAYVSANLPEFSRPVFLRLQNEIEVTGTFKQRKVDLVEEGFDPSRVSDPIYFNDSVQKTFVLMTPELYDKIQSGAVRL